MPWLDPDCFLPISSQYIIYKLSAILCTVVHVLTPSQNNHKHKYSSTLTIKELNELININVYISTTKMHNIWYLRWSKYSSAVVVELLTDWYTHTTGSRLHRCCLHANIILIRKRSSKHFKQATSNFYCVNYWDYEYGSDIPMSWGRAACFRVIVLIVPRGCWCGSTLTPSCIYTANHEYLVHRFCYQMTRLVDWKAFRFW